MRVAKMEPVQKMERKKREVKPTVETKLGREDFKRVDDLAKEDGVSKSELVRQALLWYMAHREAVSYTHLTLPTSDLV